MPEKVNGNKFSGKSNIASLNSGNTSINSKSAVQLNSSEQKLATIQKMADNSPYSQRLAQLKSLANKTTPSHQPVSQLSKASHSLPDNVKQGVENLSGISMDDVKVHYNSAKPAELNAHAYAQGTDIHIASGQEKHLPHEAWHVVQQKQGRVQPTTMMKAKVPINDDAGLEKEADVMGARALQMKPFSLSDHKTGKSVQKKGIVQKVGGEEEEDVIEAPGREAITNSPELHAERIEFKKLNKIKFNFAGSGEEVWKTHKAKYDMGGERKKGFEDADHMYDGDKMIHHKEYLDGRSMVIEYAGPIEKIGIGKLSKLGTLDSGKNSTAKNLADAKKLLDDELCNLAALLKSNDFKLDIDIKGFSRGAASASTFAKWAKGLDRWGKNLNVNLVLIDPVDGHKASAEMEKEVDVSKVHDPELPDTTGTTLMMPIKSGHWFGIFTPQKIKGYQRLILIYGSKAKHSYGLGEDDESTLHWNGEPTKGMGLSKLPKGLFIVNSDIQPLKIIQIKGPMGLSFVKEVIMGKANKKEERDQVIKNALDVELKKYLEF
jgi:hypothetical protein